MIRQRNNTDCGIACIAMVTNLEYDSVLTQLGVINNNFTYGLTSDDLVYFLSKLKYKVVVSDCLTWSDIPNNSIAFVVNEFYVCLMGHWVVYKKGKIYDPARGVFKPSKYDKQPSSYLHVTRGD